MSLLRLKSPEVQDFKSEAHNSELVTIIIQQIQDEAGKHQMVKSP